jgi:hypothetical protein
MGPPIGNTISARKTGNSRTTSWTPAPTSSWVIIRRIRKGLEVYHGKVILYAPSNILRGHTNMNSDDGYLTRLTVGKTAVEKVEVLPIAGKGQPEGRAGQPYDAKLFQPFLMKGPSARKLLEDIRGRSAQLDTRMKIDGDKGTITIPPASK